MYCGGILCQSVLVLDIPQVNVASVEGAEVFVDDHFEGLPDVSSARGSGMAFHVLGLPSDGPDLWNFDHMYLRGPSLISGTSSDPPAPTGAGDSQPGPLVLQDELRLSVSGSITDSGTGTLHVRARSSFAWPVFLGNIGLGSGWGPGVRRRVWMLMMTVFTN